MRRTALVSVNGGRKVIDLARIVADVPQARLAAVGSPLYAPGKFGSAYNPNGGYLRSDRAVGSANQEFTTVEAWVKYTGPSGAIRYAFSDIDPANPTAAPRWALGVDPAGLAYWRWQNLTVWNGSRRLDDGQWHHMAMLQYGNANNNRVKFYFDGIEVASYGGIPRLSMTSGYVIGRGGNLDAATQWVGQIDEVRVSRTARYSQSATWAVPTAPFRPDTDTLVLHHMEPPSVQQWNPLDYGPAAWYDASQITGKSDLQTVETWPDLSGKGLHVTQSDPAKRPVYRTTSPGFPLPNGKPVVWFGGSHVWLAANSHAGNLQDFSAFVVAASFATGYEGGRSTFHNGAATAADSNVGFERYPATQLAVLYGGISHNPSGQYLDADTFFLQSAVRTASGPSLRQYKNGVMDASNYTNTPIAPGAGHTLHVGTKTPSEGFWQGPIAEILIYPSVLSDAQRRKVEVYLGAKYGIAV